MLYTFQKFEFDSKMTTVEKQYSVYSFSTSVFKWAITVNNYTINSQKTYALRIRNKYSPVLQNIYIKPFRNNIQV